MSSKWSFFIVIFIDVRKVYLKQTHIETFVYCSISKSANLFLQNVRFKLKNKVLGFLFFC